MGVSSAIWETKTHIIRYWNTTKKLLINCIAAQQKITTYTNLMPFQPWNNQKSNGETAFWFIVMVGQGKDVPFHIGISNLVFSMW